MTRDEIRAIFIKHMDTNLSRAEAAQATQREIIDINVSEALPSLKLTDQEKDLLLKLCRIVCLMHNFDSQKDIKLQELGSDTAKNFIEILEYLIEAWNYFYYQRGSHSTQVKISIGILSRERIFAYIEESLDIKMKLHKFKNKPNVKLKIRKKALQEIKGVLDFFILVFLGEVYLKKIVNDLIEAEVFIVDFFKPFRTKSAN